MNTKLMTAAISGMLIGAAGLAQAHEASSAQSQATVSPRAQPLADTAGKHSCAGKNACKGQGGCKTDKHACKGQNACKGQGGCKS